MLGHLSKENNLPELAYEAVRVEVALAQKEAAEDFFTECTMKPSDFPMMVASRSEPSPIINIA